MSFFSWLHCKNNALPLYFLVQRRTNNDKGVRKINLIQRENMVIFLMFIIKNV